MLIPDSDHRQHGPGDAQKGRRPHIAAQAIDRHSVDTSLLREWLHDCRQTHKPSCSGAFSDHLAGLKVIDCQTRKIVAVPDDRSYAALSYLWGQPANAAATQPRQPDEALGGDVPQVVEDAMVVAKEIGIPHLWYCIDQADAAEKHHLIRHMDKIYNGAELTIVAAAGDDAHFGLPGVYFQCMKTYSWERLSIPPNSTGQQVDRYRVFPEDRIGPQVKDIAARLHEYVSRQLTFDSDALSAVLGIFQPYQARQVYHLWGLPFLADNALGNVERNFAMALGWYTGHPEYAERRSGFPTWSWVGWKGLDTFHMFWAPDYYYPSIEEPLPISVRVFRRLAIPGREISLPEYVTHIANGLDYTGFPVNQGHRVSFTVPNTKPVQG
ncbi:hypothetical protein C8A03DRAFT_29175 [Achaetomium macrosporum]|uniref:Heterokaryon incompatibility domain-containing protein n=1 Tax=Achaetomium macrosporum TaxID=79813 RepID=A0AAN7HEV1_9PEZI|nr:hypothetical protein C8A03DRAFT_29175 [Achaetomium macrosporum]